jgi:hypothetical protein
MNSGQEKFKELFDAFKEELEGQDRYISDFVDATHQSFESEFLGTIVLKDTKNSYDFDGQADLETVYHFVDLGIYVKFNGYYRSFDGTTFLNYEFVTPIEKITIVYE